MTFTGEAAIGNTRPETTLEQQLALSRSAQRPAENDALTPAPAKVVQRIVESTKSQ